MKYSTYRNVVRKKCIIIKIVEADNSVAHDAVSVAFVDKAVVGVFVVLYTIPEGAAVIETSVTIAELNSAYSCILHRINHWALTKFMFTKSGFLTFSGKFEFFVLS